MIIGTCADALRAYKWPGLLPGYPFIKRALAAVVESEDDSLLPAAEQSLQQLDPVKRNCLARWVVGTEVGNQKAATRIEAAERRRKDAQAHHWAGHVPS